MLISYTVPDRFKRLLDGNVEVACKARWDTDWMRFSRPLLSDLHSLPYGQPARLLPSYNHLDIEKSRRGTLIVCRKLDVTN